MSKHSIHCAGYRGAGIPFDERQCDCQGELPDDIYLQGLADVLWEMPATVTDQYDTERLQEIATRLAKMEKSLRLADDLFQKYCDAGALDEHTLPTLMRMGAAVRNAY